MTVHSTPSFNKDINKIKDDKLSARVEQAIKKLESVNSISEIKGVKRLSGSSSAYRIRIGDYRLGFTLSNHSIRLVIFAHRKEIYRYFP